MKEGLTYWDSCQRKEQAEFDVIDALKKCVGLKDYDDDSQFDDVTFDPYDMSFEFKNYKAGWKPSDEQITACLDLGFLQCWLCYTDWSEWYFHKKTSWHFKERSHRAPKVQS